MSKKKEKEERRTIKELPIEGMTCASCAQAVEKSLKDLDSVIQANVNLATEKATVEYESDKLTDQDFKKAVASAGYKVKEKPVQKESLNIEGMTCASCAQAVEEALKNVAGVGEANVNLATEKATVVYDPSFAGFKDFKKAVVNAGYKVSGRLKEGEAEAKRDRLTEDMRKVAKAKRKMWWTWLFVGPIIGWMIPEMVTGIKWPSPLIYDLGMIGLATPALFWTGLATLKSGFKSAGHLAPNMDTLIMMGTVAAYLTGYVTVLAEFKIAPMLLNYSGVAAMIMAFHLNRPVYRDQGKGAGLPGHPEAS